MRTGNVLFLLGILTTVLACGSSRSGGFKDDAPGSSPAPSTTGPIGGGEVKAGMAISLGGTVRAPNGTLPMANTLVYVTQKEPDPIPAGAYCDECVTLDKGTFAVSAADGTFEIDTELSEGDAWVVLQKGQFRRVTQVKIEKAGALTVDTHALTLPGRSNASKGDTVPKMVILKDSMDFDKIDESLQKLGITEFEIRNDRSLLEDQASLMSYQVVFIPCGDRQDLTATSETAKANLQGFVAAGGKLYVTDWSYEFVRQPFPGYVSWEKETAALGSAATGDEWDAPATAADQGLGDWLAATGDSSFEVKGSWTAISSLNTMPGTDSKGQPKDVTPKVWVTANRTSGGDPSPTTISFESQCGRVLFSTYHTESGFGGSTQLLAQEKALLYVLLEVGVCLGDVTGVE
jgi:hypothetical protein